SKLTRPWHAARGRGASCRSIAERQSHLIAPHTPHVSFESLAPVVGCGVVEPLEQLGIDPIRLDRLMRFQFLDYTRRYPRVVLLVGLGGRCSHFCDGLGI